MQTLDETFLNETIREAGALNMSLKMAGSRTARNSPLHVFEYYRKWLSRFEESLLKIWHLKEQAGKDFEISAWLNLEVGKKNHLFILYRDFIKAVSDLTPFLQWKEGENPIEKVLFFTLSDQKYLSELFINFDPSDPEAEVEFFKQLKNFERKNPWKKFLDFFPTDQTGLAPQFKNPIQDSTQPSAKFLWFSLWEDFSEGKPNFAESLRDFWKHRSGGIFSLCSAFSFTPENFSPLEPVPDIRQVQFSDLVRIEEKKKILTENTERLFQEGFAHHVFLWGYRGTGKSSSVLALLNEFIDRELKIIEIRQNRIEFLPELEEAIAELPEKFLIYIDDLSFEEGEIGYKQLKNFMEGRLKNDRRNSILIVTGNRKSLVDHTEGKDQFDFTEKRRTDEMRALDDRFAIKIFYDLADFQELEDVFREMVSRKGIEGNLSELFESFKQYCFLNGHDTPSCRNIEQFLKISPS